MQFLTIQIEPEVHISTQSLIQFVLRFFVSKLLFDDTINDTINLRGKKWKNVNQKQSNLKKVHQN